jgi:hypothetical protein
MAAHALGAQLGAMMAVLGAGGVLGATGETTASTISTKRGACFFLPLSYLARRRRFRRGLVPGS